MTVTSTTPGTPQPPAPPSPPPHGGAEPPLPPATAWGTSVLAPVAAGLATICASTSLTGVVAGWTWLGYIIIVVVLVACTGLALRSVRAPTIVVGLSQLLVVTFLVTGVFTRSGIGVIVPGPAALSELRDVLAASAEQIRTGLAPVPGSLPILCLVTIAIGLVAVLVDTLAVAAAAPAATGLVLLCVYAVPASLSDRMLPWWTFLLGAAAFAALLAVDGNHRHRSWRNRAAPGLGGSPRAASTPLVVVCMALSLGLVAGVALTGVGTAGKLPGNGPGGRGIGGGGLGLDPFTSVRGLLDQGENVELFRVRGLGEDKRLLRAFTLDTYYPNKGWGLPANRQMTSSVPANQALPPAPGDNGTGQSREIQIEPTNWVDNWLPIYGAPRALRGLSGDWSYDRTTGAVFATKARSAPSYTESASLAEPSKDQLRQASVNARDIPPIYSTIDQVDPRVSGLARTLTQNKDNNFDKATAIWQFLTAPNGFTYDTSTAPPTDSDALADFLLVGKRGFCEQFASAMGVMLRSLGIPSRVAVGFTTGYTTADYRAITSQDAHAWVEVYFGDRGWVSFDPTPLADGRGYVPGYLQPDDTPTGTTDPSSSDQPSDSASREAPTGAPLPDEPDPAAAGAQTSDGGTPGWVLWAGLLAGLAAAALTIRMIAAGKRAADRRDPEQAPSTLSNWLPLITAGLWVLAIGLAAWWVSVWLALVLLVLIGAVFTPSLIREVNRRRRLQTITGHGAGAADAAWLELSDECADRGLPIPESDTVRTAVQKLTHQHRLDEEGKDGLRTVIGVLERSWYSAEQQGDPALAPAFENFRRSLRRNAPMSWRGRLLPRSLFRRKR